MTNSQHWTEQTSTKPLNRAVLALTRKVERAYYECRFQDACALHDDLMAAQWRLNLSIKRGE